MFFQQAKTNHFLIIGLGNPGKDLEFTRHNTGMLAAKYCIDKKGLNPHVHNNKKIYSQYKQDKDILWVIPDININESGRIVKEVLEEYEVANTNICILYDEVNMPIGTFKVRYKRGSGGHNGLESIITTLGTRAFVTISIGIGKPSDMSVYDYVVTRFSDTEYYALLECFERICGAIECWVNEGREQCQSKYNTARLNK